VLSSDPNFVLFVVRGFNHEGSALKLWLIRPLADTKVSKEYNTLAQRRKERQGRGEGIKTLRTWRLGARNNPNFVRFVRFVVQRFKPRKDQPKREADQPPADTKFSKEEM
jgi:hypothetical protein